MVAVEMPWALVSCQLPMTPHYLMTLPVAIAVNTLRQFGFNPSSSVDFSHSEGDAFSLVKHSPALIARIVAECALEYSVKAKVLRMDLLEGVVDNEHRMLLEVKCQRNNMFETFLYLSVSKLLHNHLENHGGAIICELFHLQLSTAP